MSETMPNALRKALIAYRLMLRRHPDYPAQYVKIGRRIGENPRQAVNPLVVSCVDGVVDPYACVSSARATLVSAIDAMLANERLDEIEKPP